MLVLHTVASLRPETGGPARSVPGLASALARNGVQVHLWSPEIPDGFEESQGVTVHRGSLEQVIAGLKGLDLVHDHGLWLPVNHRVASLCREQQIPRMVSPRGMLEPWALNHKRWKKRAAWWLYQRRDLTGAVALHATADSEAEQFRHLGLKNPIHVIPNGVDLPPTTDNRQPTTGPKTALFLSRIHPKKGLPMLVEAWASVRPAGWRMKVVGPDEDGHRAELESMVRKAGLEGEWEFPGPLEGPRKHEAFGEASLFILPTFSENFGIAVAEALASGVPVITTTGAPWSGLTANHCGWWVAPTTGEIVRILAEATRCSHEVLAEMGRNGREWVKREFSWCEVARQMTAAYEGVME